MKFKNVLRAACATLAIAVTAPSVAAQDAPKSDVVEAVTNAIDLAKTAPASKATSVTLRASTPINFTMDKSLATDKREKVKGEKKDKTKERLTNAGEIFYMSVAEDVVVDGQVVIPKGSRGVGEVLSVTGRGGFGKSGKIEVQMNHVEVGSNKYPMEGVHLQKGKGRGGAAVAGVILAGALAGVFIKGDEADMPAGMQLSFRTKDSITVNVANSSNVSQKSSPQAAETETKREGILEDIAQTVDKI
ncbi:MAG: hypothetical protein KAZ17_01110 [Sphingorhabdus sp.]|nr:hypothetical protein [Sphingorhabdus sp.]